MQTGLINKPSAFFPLVMSVTALGIVLGYAVMFGIARQADEGAVAHIWQLLMAGQIPVIVFFAIRWMPTQRNQGIFVLAVQLGAALTAMFPVWWFGW